MHVYNKWSTHKALDEKVRANWRWFNVEGMSGITCETLNRRRINSNCKLDLRLLVFLVLKQRWDYVVNLVSIVNHESLIVESNSVLIILQVNVLVNSKYFVAVRREAEIWVNCPYLKSRQVWRQHFSYKTLSTKCFHNWTTESKWAVDNKLKVACEQNGYFKTSFDLKNVFNHNQRRKPPLH